MGDIEGIDEFLGMVKGFCGGVGNIIGITNFLPRSEPGSRDSAE